MGDLQKKARNWMLSILWLIVMAYGWVAFLGFVPYFNWQYAKQHGFVNWLLLGEVVPTLKAIVWPYFVFFDKTVDKETIDHLVKCFDYSNQATDLLGDKNKPNYDKGKAPKILELYKKSLAEAKQVDIDQLNQIYDGFGTHFRDECKRGLEYTVEGYEKENIENFLKGYALLSLWSDWYSEHIEIQKIGENDS